MNSSLLPYVASSLDERYLSIREHLRFHAALLLPLETPTAVLDVRVEEVVRGLGIGWIDDCLHKLQRLPDALDVAALRRLAPAALGGLHLPRPPL